MLILLLTASIIIIRILQNCLISYNFYINFLFSCLLVLPECFLNKTFFNIQYLTSIGVTGVVDELVTDGTVG